MTKMESFRKHSGKFVSRIVKDFRHKELLPLKLLFFINASTLFVLYPYLTIHMRELGINVEETAIMSAVTPIVAIIMPPLAGMVADKIGNFKLMLSLFSTLGGGAALLLLLVPIGRITVTYPDEVILTIGCGSFNTTDSDQSSLEFALAEDLPCNQTFRYPEFDLSSKLETCGFVCQTSVSPKEGLPEAFKSGSSEEDETELSVDSVLKARSYSIRLVDDLTKVTTSYSFNLTQEDMIKKTTKLEALSNRYMKNNQNFQTALRRISQNKYFLPAKDLNTLSCSPVEEEFIDSRDFLLSSRFSRMKRDYNLPSYSCDFLSQDNSSEWSVMEGSSLSSRLEKTQKNSSYKVKELQWNSTKINPVCQSSEYLNSEATVYLHNPENHQEVVHEILLEYCQPTCLLTTRRSDICRNLQKEIVYDPSLTFWVYMVIRVFIGIIGGTAFAMFEGAVIAVLREQNADYGLQRIYASFGGMISSPLSGLLIDYASEGKGYTDFRPAFYLYAGLKLIGGVLMLTINLEFKVGSENVVADVMAVLKKIEVIALLIASFILGTSWGYIESFLFWLIQDLGGSRSLMGITITVGGLAGIPLLALSGPIINRIGHANVIFIGFIFYAVRLLGYSLIYNPWHCLFFEAMESVTTSLAFTAAVTYAAKLSTTTTDSSIQGLLGGLYFGVGKGAGSLVGGYLMKGVGTRTTFQIFAVFTAFMGCIYFFFNKFYLKKLPQTEGNDICKKKPKPIKDLDLKVVDDKPKEAVKKVDDIKVNKDQSHDNPAFIAEPTDKSTE